MKAAIGLVIAAALGATADQAAATSPGVSAIPSCPRCKAAIPNETAFCPACGKKQPRPDDVHIAFLGMDMHVPAGDLAWLAVGILGQLMFAGRFFVQWLVSEKQGRSVVPPAFWYMSLIGGLMVLAYGIRSREVVIIISQAFNPIIYLRNIMLMRKGAAPPGE